MNCLLSVPLCAPLRALWFSFFLRLGKGFDYAVRKVIFIKVKVSSLRLILTFISCITLLFAGCSDRQDRLKQFDVDETIRGLAEQYIKAQYAGDTATLSAITREAAAEAVESGELEIFKSHKLNRILSFNFIKTEEPYQRLVIAAVESAPEDKASASNYYEHLYFKKFEGKWYIVKVERDA